MSWLHQLRMNGLEVGYALGLLGVFVAVCLVVAVINQILMEPLRKRRELAKRLKSKKMEQELRAKIFKAYQESRLSPVASLMGRLTGWSKVDNLERQLIQADIYLAPGVFILLVALLGVLGVFIGMLLLEDIWAWVFGAAIGFLPILVLRWKRRRKTAQFEKQMPEAMELLARSLRAGHTLPATMELVAQEIKPPLGKEMRITYEEQRLGLSVGQALRRMGERVASRDLRYFVTAVLIQSETGGNLAEILENIGNLIRERMQLKGKVKALTAEGRFSALVLMGLPLITFLALFFMSPDYITILLTDPWGKDILTAVVVSLAIGGVVMKRMVNIQV